MNILDIIKNQLEAGGTNVLCANLYKDGKVKNTLEALKNSGRELSRMFCIKYRLKIVYENY